MIELAIVLAWDRGAYVLRGLALCALGLLRAAEIVCHS
jgi:hypothetical protein